MKEHICKMVAKRVHLPYAVVKSEAQRLKRPVKIRWGATPIKKMLRENLL